MACDKCLRLAAGAAARSGIPGGVNKKAFFIGAAMAGTLLAGLVLSRRLVSPPAPPASKIRPVKLKTLSGPERAEPMLAENLAGRHCAGCQASSQEKHGLWYQLRNQAYCQDCAQKQAATAGVSLILPALSKASHSPLKHREGRRISLKPTFVSLGPLGNLEGYAVTTEGKETGLTITPEFKLEAGQVRVNRAHWFVNYQRAGKAVAGPYSSLNEARGMASLVAYFDWTQPVEEFKDEEIRAIVGLTTQYREDLEFAQCMQQINKSTEK